ncbi:geraniol 8-hydroxylase-like [Coffea arabica]|uniref:Geraniol 8-hydroxylase-like n=1 Tax=Coffea arabica TaxID=13443 RepID=A0ABM4V194_COFAR|nr:geraniol 8-hydroxylase-like [Coffea arabica]
MDSLMVVLASLLSLTLIKGLSSLARRAKKHPPGPTPLPLIGNLHLLGDLPHQSLAKLAKIHGPVTSLKLGQLTTVVISSSSMAREVLQKKDLAFSSRSIPDAVHAQNHSHYSVVWLPVASRWRSLRRIMNSNMFSANSLDANQHLRCRKVQELVDCCQKNCQTGEAVDIGRAGFMTSLNLLSNTIFSKDLADPYSDTAKEFKDLVWDIMVEAGKPNPVDFFPLLKKFDPRGVRRRMSVHFEKVLKLFEGLINERLESGNSGDEGRDVLDELLTTSEESSQEFDRIHMVHMFLDLFVAGTDTTSSTLEWAMTELLKNPEKMRKAQAEIAGGIGKGKAIEEADVARLPYLQCIVKETLRIHPPVPFLIPRRVEQDVELCGYNVPKGSQVLVNAWAICRDEIVWENALVFKPERFLESEIDIRGRDFELIPFGAGRRICPGLPLAARVVPVMLGSLLNSFDWKLEGGNTPKDLDMEEKYGITLQKALPLRAVPLPL